MSVTQTQQPDLAAVKGRQRHAWASGDYSAVAARIVPMAEKLIEAADLQAGQRVLDVAWPSWPRSSTAARGRRWPCPPTTWRPSPSAARRLRGLGGRDP